MPLFGVTTVSISSLKHLVMGGVPVVERTQMRRVGNRTRSRCAGKVQPVVTSPRFAESFVD